MAWDSTKSAPSAQQPSDRRNAHHRWVSARRSESGILRRDDDFSMDGGVRGHGADEVEQCALQLKRTALVLSMMAIFAACSGHDEDSGRQPVKKV
jgi:hypothetical protein